MTVARESDAFDRRLQACVGGASTGIMAAAHAVNQAMIAAWADALLDGNPVYVDEEAARATGREGIIAPPTMVQAWVMPKLSDMALGCRDVPGMEPYFQGRTEIYPPASDASGEVYRILAERGFTNSAATNCRQVYHRELRPGDRLQCRTTVEKVSGRKHTAMGPGHFITTRWEYLDQAGRNVASQHWTVLRFRAPSDAGPADAARRKPERQAVFAMVSSDGPAGGALKGAPRPGQVTSAKIIPITPSFVIATALATHDFYPIHHDVDWARSVGSPNIFSNILTTTGLVGGVMTRWGGPRVRLRSVDLRLLAPNYPGDELTLIGRVSSVDEDEVTMAVTGVNRIGVHVEATVIGAVPTV